MLFQVVDVQATLLLLIFRFLKSHIALVNRHSGKNESAIGSFVGVYMQVSTLHPGVVESLATSGSELHLHDKTWWGYYASHVVLPANHNLTCAPSIFSRVISKFHWCLKPRCWNSFKMARDDASLKLLTRDMIISDAGLAAFYCNIDCYS